MTAKMIAISLPEKLIKHLNAEALVNYETRSEYVKRAIIGRMRADGADISSDKIRTRDEVERKRLQDFLASLEKDDFIEDIT